MMAVVWLHFTTGSRFAQVTSEAADPLSDAAPLSINSREVRSQAVLITWSEKNDELRGFSNKLGDWEILKIAPQEKIIPLVKNNVAAVRFGDSVAAFSGEKGWWDVIELSKDSKSEPICHPSLVVIEDNGHLYTFAAEKGRWTSPTDPKLQPLVKKIETPPKFPKGRNAAQAIANIMSDWIASLPRHKGRGISIQVDRFGTFMISVDRSSLLAEVEKYLDKVFQEALQQTDSKNSQHAIPDPKNQDQQLANRDEQIAKMRAELAELDKTTQSAGSRETASTATDVNQGEDAEGLRSQVEQTFDVRQQLQELEAEKLRLKLQMIESNLESRQKNRDRIIERRVEELLTTGIGDSSKSKKEHPAKSRIELLVFGVAYAEPFQKMKPIVKSMIEDGLPVRILDITTDKEQARRFKIDTIPTFVVTIDGQESRRFIGARSEAELRREIRFSTRELETEAGTTSPVELPGPPRLPDGHTEAVGPFQKDANPTSATGPTNNQNTAAAMKWRQPSEVVKLLRNGRNPLANQVEKTKWPQEQVDKYSRPLNELIADGTLGQGTDEVGRDAVLKSAQNDLNRHLNLQKDADRDWRQAWSEYQSHLRLLQLDVEESQVALAEQGSELERAKQLNETGNIPFSTFQQAVTKHRIAEIQLKRTAEILRLYADIEKNEPALNPDFKPETETAPELK